jgi:antitoxin VapB
VAEPWHAGGKRLAELTAGLRVGADGPGPGLVDLADEIVHLRWPLTPAEVDRFRVLGAAAGAAIGEAARAVRPGMTEYAVAGLLAEATYRHGATPIVTLIAADARMLTRRHPLPTDRRMERGAMLVLCARRAGLVASVTRLMHYGPVPAEMQRALHAVATIDATVVQATRPGVHIRDIFATLVQTYAATGYPGEWQRHHQGGPVGYEAREYIATPDSPEIVAAGQPFAWNPSVPGAKSEDTFLITEAGAELLTATPDWPQVQVAVNGAPMDRPDILRLDLQ